jgi:ATP-dependent DNA ligase
VPLFHPQKRIACELDVEGIVAKRAASPYKDNPTGQSWITIKNPSYAQKEGVGTYSKELDRNSPSLPYIG